jgi:diguanylate cyclase (GGDEF)-like protein
MRLHQQACVELDALGAALATQRRDGDPAPSQLAALARTLDRIGSRAEKLEQEVGQMRHCAYHDPLTGLPNRTLLLDRLDRALAQAARRNGQVALLMLDLDDFKAVNDRFGHAVGDQLLRGVADRLQRSARDADTICRYGGDEFVILLPEVDGRPGATVVVKKIQASLSTPILVAGHSITVCACVGMAVYPLDGIAPIHLLQRADVAMYGAKDDPMRRQPSEAWV